MRVGFWCSQAVLVVPFLRLTFPGICYFLAANSPELTFERPDFLKEMGR